MLERVALPSPLSVHSSGVAIPHPDKLKQGVRGWNSKVSGYAGEDAYFCAPGAHIIHAFAHLPSQSHSMLCLQQAIGELRQAKLV